MAIRLSGLSSGLDTESIIKELMSAQSLKLRKIENKKTKLEWKEEKWKDLNKKIYGLYTDQLSKIRLQSSYLTKKLTTSDSSKATITAGTNVPSGTHSIEIKKLASSQFVTGSQISTLNGVDASTITSNTTLSSIGIREGTEFTFSTSTRGTGTFIVTESSKLSDLISFAKTKGVNISYDSKNQRFFASSIDSGVDNAFSLRSSMPLQQDVANLQKLKDDVGYDFLDSKQKEEVDQAFQTICKGTYASDEYKEAELLLSRYADAYQDTYDALGTVEDATEFGELFNEKINNNVDFKIEDSIITSDLQNLNATYGQTTESALTLLGLGEIEKDGIVVGTSTAQFVEAANCEIKYNNEEYKSSSNTVVINGLTINAIETTTTSGAIRVNVTNDTDGVYKVIKDFVKSYNSILKEVNELYYAGSARDYDVLTSEEKEAMTEEEVEKWEKKIKDSLFRNDTSLGMVRSALTSLANISVEVNNESYSLSSFGIHTTDYTEKGLLHIDGDSDDGVTSANKDKLLAAINSDPDKIMEVFSKIGSELYSTLTEKMASTSLSSALTFYNDKQITSQKKNYDAEIKKMKEKLDDLENRYYKKFTAMEKALSKLDSQNAYIAGMFSS